MMYKTPTFAEPQQYNSCNKNDIKNTEMLENYIYCIPIKKINKSVLIS